MPEPPPNPPPPAPVLTQDRVKYHLNAIAAGEAAMAEFNASLNRKGVYFDPADPGRIMLWLNGRFQWVRPLPLDDLPPEAFVAKGVKP
jgi:hypothetical protein